MAQNRSAPPLAGLELVPAEPGFLKDLLERPDLDSFLRDAAEQTLVHQAKTGAVAPWTGYFARLGADWVGICAFVDRPRAGAVEIAYGTAPGFEGRGIATAMVARLTALAFESDAVTVVAANTAPMPSASTHILEKLGFTRDGVIQDAEIGEAWHWTTPRR